MDTDVVPLSHFELFVICMYAKDTNFIFGIPQIYTCIDTQGHAHTSAETPAHTDTDTCTQIYISTHADIHRHTCIFFYIHKHTYIFVRSIFPAHFILVAICQMSSGPHRPIFEIYYWLQRLICLNYQEEVMWNFYKSSWNYINSCDKSHGHYISYTCRLSEYAIFYLSQLSSPAALPHFPDQPSKIKFEKFPLDLVQLFNLIWIPHMT